MKSRGQTALKISFSNMNPWSTHALRDVVADQRSDSPTLFSLLLLCVLWIFLSFCYLSILHVAQPAFLFHCFSVSLCISYFIYPPDIIMERSAGANLRHTYKEWHLQELTGKQEVGKVIAIGEGGAGGPAEGRKTGCGGSHGRVRVWLYLWIATQLFHYS